MVLPGGVTLFQGEFSTRTGWLDKPMELLVKSSYVSIKLPPTLCTGKQEQVHAPSIVPGMSCPGLIANVRRQKEFQSISHYAPQSQTNVPLTKRLSLTKCFVEFNLFQKRLVTCSVCD